MEENRKRCPGNSEGRRDGQRNIKLEKCSFVYFMWEPKSRPAANERQSKEENAERHEKREKNGYSDGQK